MTYKNWANKKLTSGWFGW